MMRKKIISLIVVLAFVCTALAFPVQADSNPLSTDEYLKTRGFPDSVLAEMDEDFKDYIAGTMDKDPSYAFANYETKDMSAYSTRSPQYIPDTEMKLNVVTIKSGSTYQIYPNFIWNTVTILKNDSFSFCLPDGWRLVSGKTQLTIHYLDTYSHSWKTTVISNPSDTLGFSGYTYRLGDSIMNRRTNFKGYGFFYATKTTASANEQVRVLYVDDTSPFGNFAYGINLSGFTLTYYPSSSTLRSAAGLFDINPN